MFDGKLEIFALESFYQNRRTCARFNHIENLLDVKTM